MGGRWGEGGDGGRGRGGGGRGAGGGRRGEEAGGGGAARGTCEGECSGTDRKSCWWDILQLHSGVTQGCASTGKSGKMGWCVPDVRWCWQADSLRLGE